MRSRYLRTGLCIAILGIVACAEWANADALADAARAIVEANKDAVVTIKLVIENRYSMEGSGSDSEESIAEVTGTVLDPSGLTVVSLFTTDPTSASRNMMGMDLEEMGFKIETEIKRADILAADGNEIPAEVVLRDKDLDLAFLRPKQKPEKPFAALGVAQAGTAGQLDPIVAISRLGRVANRAHGALLDRIEAVAVGAKAAMIVTTESSVQSYRPPCRARTVIIFPRPVPGPRLSVRPPPQPASRAA